MFPYELTPPFSFAVNGFSQILTSSSNLSSETHVTEVTRAHQYLVTKHNSTVLSCDWQDHVNGGASEIWAVLSHSSWLRQSKVPAAPPRAAQSDDRATRLKQPGSLSCCRKDGWPGASPRLRRLWEQEVHFCYVKLLWVQDCLRPTSTPSLPERTSLVDISRAPKIHLKSNHHHLPPDSREACLLCFG